MKKIFSKETAIGIVFIAALFLLFVGINYLRGVNVFKTGHPYYISLNNVTGLSVSAPVNINGFKVGQVRNMTYDKDKPGYVIVEIDLDDEVQLPEGTIALMESDLLGTASINLKLGQSKEIISEGSWIPGEVPGGMLDKVTQTLLPAVDSVVPKVDSLLTNVNTLVADPALKRALERIDVMTENLVSTTQQLNALMATLPPVTANAQQITGNLVRTSDGLNGLMNDVGGTVANINGLIANVNSLITTVNDVALGIKDIPLNNLVDTIQTTLQNLEKLTADLNAALNSSDSTLGKIFNDPALYNNINHTIQSLDSLFNDIKQNPKRYISIKLL